MKEVRSAVPAAELLDLFEEAWQRSAPLRIEDVLLRAAANEPARRQLLEELIATDLEYRWRRAKQAAGQDARPRLEDYVRRFPELGRADRLPLALIGQEYRARHCWGDHPGHGEYSARFQPHGAALADLLKRIDRELASEFGRDGRGLIVPPTMPDIPPDASTVTSSITVPEALRSLPLLTPAQLHELERGLTKRFPEPRDLARELLRRNWLTPYQVNQLLQGRGRDLVVGQYVLLERLGEGGVGQVFKARHRQQGQVVALKVIRKELLTDAEVVGRFRREIEVLSKLDHPNVVRARDAGIVGTTYFLAMEFVEGSDLGRLVKQGGPMPVLQACSYVRQAALGLQHAHERGLVHRDIKPHNLIMSVRDGLIKVADLGLARLPRAVNQEATAVLHAQAGTGTLTPQGAVMMGTPDYMAPEQALAFHAADIRADIYSLGCTFFFLLTGQSPFGGGTLAQTLLRHQQSAPQDVGKLRSDLPVGLAAVLARMLAKRPEDRFQTPAEVAAALASFSGPGTAARVSLPRPASRWLAKVGRWRLLAVSAVLLLLFFAWRWLGPSEDRARRNALQARMDQPGSPAALRAGRQLMEMSWPLDRLDGSNIPADLRGPALPPEVIAVLRPPGGATDIHRVAFSPDGTVIAAAGRDKVIHLWDSATGKYRTGLAGHTDSIRGLAFSPDGKTLASASDDRSVRLWDMATGRERSVLGSLGGLCSAAVFSLDGGLLATASNDGVVRVWDLTLGGERCNFRPKAPVYSMAFAPDGLTLALGTDEAAEVWRTTGPRQLTTHGARSCRLVAVAPDGLTMAHNSADAPQFQLREMNSGKMNGLVLKQELHSTPRYLTYTPDGALLVAIDDGAATAWDVATFQQVGYWKLPWGVFSTASCGDLAPDGRHLATGHGNGNVYIRRLFPAPKK